MSVRSKITILFSAIVFCILGLLCTSIYIFSIEGRKKHISSRLTNMAITTGNFLSREEIFNHYEISKIDSLTTISFTHKTIQAFDLSNNKIYSFNDDEDDVLLITPAQLKEARSKKKVYSRISERDLIFYHYTVDKSDMVIVTAGYDLIGHQNLSRLLSILSLSFLLGMSISIMAGYIFSSKLLKPIGEIADDVNDISAQSLAKRIGTGTSPDEWNYLAKSLNKLLDRLQASFETQSRFISNASHELSTPLASISSQLEISLRKERSNEEYKKIMHSIHNDIRHLGKLTHILLEFAKASGSKSGIEIKPVRIDEILMRLSSEINKSNNNFSASLDFIGLPKNEEHLIVYGNEELLFTAIKNIAMNACKYSDNQKSNISLTANDKNVSISVWNTGVGIPKEELENIFQPFYRIEKLNGHGFGLGLSLARRIIKLHKGEITVSSEPGGVTIFTVNLTHTESTPV